MPVASETDLIIEHQERRVILLHQGVVKKLKAMLKDEDAQAEDEQDIQLEIKHNLDEWKQVARKAAARPGIAGKINDVIDSLVAAGRPNSDSLPAERVGPSGINQLNFSAASARANSSDDDDEPQAGASGMRKRPRNPFILDETEEAADNDEELEAFHYHYNDYEFLDDD